MASSYTVEISLNISASFIAKLVKEGVHFTAIQKNDTMMIITFTGGF